MTFPRMALLSLLTALLLITGGTAALADDATPSTGPGHRDPGPQPTPPRESPQARTGARAATPTANLGLTYRALSAPCRVYDSRSSGGILTAGSTRTVTVKGVCGIPVTARQIVGTIAATGVTQSGGYFTGYAVGTTRPTAATLNYNEGTTSSGVTLPLRATPTPDLAVYTNRQAHLILDVTGFYEEAMQGTIQLGVTPSLVYGTSQLSVRTTGAGASAYVDFPRSIVGCAILTSSQSTYVSVATFDTSSTTVYLLARDNGSDEYVDAVVYVQVVC